MTSSGFVVIVIVKIKVQPLPVQALRAPEILHNRRMIVVKFSALRTDHLYP